MSQRIPQNCCMMMATAGSVKAKALKGYRFGSDDDIKAMAVQWF
jgi:hypothetical protein